MGDWVTQDLEAAMAALLLISKGAAKNPREYASEVFHHLGNQSMRKRVRETVAHEIAHG